MKAMVVARSGGPEGLEMREQPDPQPRPDEVVVKVHAAGLNFADLISASGGYSGVPDPPFIAGREFSGMVESTGEPVMGYTQWGAFAGKVAAKRALLWPKPERFSFAQAAAFPVNYFTAWFAYWRAGLTPGAEGKNPGSALREKHGTRTRPRVLIHAVAGGVGTAAVEIGRALGVEMFGTASSETKLTRARELGLDHGINYTREDYEERIAELTSGEGVNAVFEMLGGEHTAKSVRCLAFLGSVVTYGAATGSVSRMDPRILYARNTSVHGLWLSRLAEQPKIMIEAWERLSHWIEGGILQPVVGHTLPLEKAADAYRIMMERKNVGKIVLEV
ncbi:MAG TPA: NADPH:quinone oxidoreductase family protein [Terriglobales bacterium]|nr:NADPH:quinone oxidoreductase family protein [Terriglobales bacterium]